MSRETHARCVKLGRPGEGCAVPLPEILPLQATKLHGLRDDLCNLVGRAMECECPYCQYIINSVNRHHASAIAHDNRPLSITATVVGAAVGGFKLIATLASQYDVTAATRTLQFITQSRLSALH